MVLYQNISKVSRYNENGFQEYLPDLSYATYLHGCAGYYNDKDQLVKRFL